MVAKPLVDYTDAELRELLEATAAHLSYNYNDLVGEMNRRAALRQGRVAIVTSYVSAGVAVFALVVSLIALFARPH